MEKLAAALGLERAAWTASGDRLPGGDFADAERRIATWAQRWPWLPTSLLHRWLRHYGTCAEALLGDAAALGDLGHHFGAGLYQREVDYLVHHEWIRAAEDILWRRTKLGLRMNDEERRGLRAYLDQACAELARGFPSAAMVGSA